MVFLIAHLNPFVFILHLFVCTGTKVEGILRQSADVEEVERRVQEYEQGIDLVHMYLFFWV